MKNIYQSPEVEILNFAAAEKLAALGLGLNEIGAPTIGGSETGDIPLIF